MDFLPVGSASQGTITWPKSRQVMTIVGFDLTFTNQSEVTIGVDTPVAVADLPVVVLLKMIVFLDNPADRMRDLHDIFSVLVWNEEAAGDSLFNERFIELDLQPDEAAAFLIGESVGRIADVACRSRIHDFFVTAAKGHLGLLSQRAGIEASTIERLWAALRAGVGISAR